MGNSVADKTIYLFATIGALTRYCRYWGEDALARWEHRA
ncbi:hypothetical protein R20943_05523 [Paraburkholderia aspalathi]|nr:hypothetical protein R20943_05523 [Paraburkholderia aspalathi]